MERVGRGTWTQPAPIGFYFAKLWYYETLYPLILYPLILYPLIFTVGALTRAREAIAQLKRIGMTT